MIYDEIRATLETHLASLSGLPPVVPENVRFTPQEGSPYIQTSLVPIRTRIRTLRGSNNNFQRYQGWFQIRIMTPRFGGTGTALSLVDEIANHFEVGKSLTTGSGFQLTIEYADVGNKSLQDTHFSTILNVGWYIYAT